MKFGLAFPYNATRSYAGWAQQAEQAGWDGCFLGDAIWCEDPMIGLAVMAMATHRVRLGTLINPVPLRQPWKLASEAIALDLLSQGRLTLGLGTGATWMGWYAFPDVVTDNRTRAEMLDETIEILTLLDRRKPFDYDGKHFHLKLTELPEMHYPPKPVQQPRIPIWAPLHWPRSKSKQRVLKCDGLIAEKLSPQGEPQEVTPADLREMKAFVQANRAENTPFDFVIIGKSGELSPQEQQEVLAAWREAGATWWVEDLWGQPHDEVSGRIESGPPQLA